MTGFSYTIKQLALFCKAQFKGDSQDEIIREVVLDSRKAKHFHHHLYIALHGPHHDGHEFISDLYQRGARNFLISSNTLNTSGFPNANFLMVNDTLQAFQSIAKNHRLKSDIPTIGITGSNGENDT